MAQHNIRVCVCVCECVSVCVCVCVCVCFKAKAKEDLNRLLRYVFVHFLFVCSCVCFDNKVTLASFFDHNAYVSVMYRAGISLHDTLHLHTHYDSVWKHTCVRAYVHAHALTYTH